MCARYTMTSTNAEELGAEFDVSVMPPSLEPSFNIAPTEAAPIVITDKEGERLVVLARFGFVPHWADSVKIGTRFLNARSESIADKPAFRDAFARHRCLVAADGFYEWRREGKLKIPFHFHLRERNLLAFAGLWSVWRDPNGARVTSFTILTRDAEGAAAAIHDRMPVVLAKKDYAAWLDRSITEAEATLPILDRHRGAELVGTEVSRRVNDVKNDDESLLDPV
jgi:putative SOS response-associated peptidase YedK